MRKHKPRRIPRTAYDEIVALADKRLGPAEIERELKRLDLPKVTLPTIRDIWRERNPPDGSGRWSIFDASSDEAQIVLGVLRIVYDWSSGRISSFTQREAKAVLAVHHAAPAMWPYKNHFVMLWAIAMEYIRRQDADEECWDLDLLLASGADLLPGDTYWKLEKLREEEAAILLDATLRGLKKGLQNRLERKESDSE